jgi:hypothetical protein
MPTGLLGITAVAAAHLTKRLHFYLYITTALFCASMIRFQKILVLERPRAVKLAQ